MEVRWTYRSLGKGKTELEKPVEILCFALSLESWRIFCPEARRVGIFDSVIEKIVIKNKLDKYFDDIEVLDFNKTLDVEYPNGFFASPKLYATMNIVEDQTFIVDTELVLRKPIKEWFNSNNYYVRTYVAENPLNSLNWIDSDWMSFRELTLRSTKVHKYCNPEKMINAGIVYYPKREVANQVGKIVLEVGQDLEKLKKYHSRYSWTFYEESTIVPTILSLDPEASIVDLQKDLSTCEEFSNRWETQTVCTFFKDICLQGVPREILTPDVMKLYLNLRNII